MVKVRLNKNHFPDKYWLKYCNDAGIVKKISLTGCANSFKLATGDTYDTGDGLKGVGWRYEENGCLCYELFCIGHLQLSVPLRPSMTDRIGLLLRGKNAQEGYREKLEAFEKALNLGGWKTVPKPDGVEE